MKVGGLKVSVSAIFSERYGSAIMVIYESSVKRKRTRCGSNLEVLFLLLIVFKEQGSCSVLKRSRACGCVHACILPSVTVIVCVCVLNSPGG